MSFLAVLKLDEEEYRILYCSFAFHKEIDPTGKPISIPLGGVLEIKLESNRKTNFYDWMISPTLVKSGTITFFRRDEMSRLKSLEFNDSHCIAYKETFDHLGENPMMIELKLSARELKINDSTFYNNWPD
ncbi:hypothetical protein SAMN00777080_2734 [Aquiflexum balticum DSM 16537]|uniref:Uncharacterized protein n=1 Tax=Aquiflexum balticum DSM 16537 TaxID=758820 RepID=A0A1W2H5H3_9BACT|nr:type VI secretion system tube protein TssD [Aquiflexum balticum]SMD44119.1 hypothetical protein SAMN00777080_2734 [Aquiflexum balticum DSM 16537]